MGALQRHRAAVVKPAGQLQHLFQAVHPRPERRQLQAQRRELLGAPAGAEAGRHPLPADEDGQLAELSQQQRGVDPRRVHDDGLEFEPVGEPGHSGQRRHRLTAGIGAVAPVSPVRGQEDVVGDGDTGGAGVLERGDTVAQRGATRRRRKVGEFDEHLHGAATPSAGVPLGAAAAAADRDRTGIDRPDGTSDSSPFAESKVMMQWARLYRNQMPQAQV